MRRFLTVILLAAGLVASGVTVTPAAQYPGWGDTGWIYASKRECCNEAIAIASQYSADFCVNSGGLPRSFLGGGQRGSCKSEWMQDETGTLLYRCYGEASVWCR